MICSNGKKANEKVIAGEPSGRGPPHVDEDRALHCVSARRGKPGNLLDHV